MQNASLSNALRSTSQNNNVEMVSVSFDEYQSMSEVEKEALLTKLDAINNSL
jgi:hypothetical protein